MIKYNQLFKQQVVNFYFEHHENLALTLKHFNLAAKTVRYWISQSMSRKGNCLDNAAMESFFGRMKTECFHGKLFTGIDKLEKVINDYVRYYNEERIQLKLKGLSPIQYRKQSFK